MVFPGTDAGMLHFLDVEKHEEYNGSLLRYTSMNYVETRVYTSGVIIHIIILLTLVEEQRGKMV